MDKQINDFFFQVPNRVVTDQSLKSNDIVCFMHLFNRMRLSSTKKKDFWDKKHNNYYIIYSQKAMAKAMRITTKTVGKIYEKLEKSGYIIRESFSHAFNAPSKILIPDFSVYPNKKNLQFEQEKNTISEEKKILPSNSDLSNSDYNQNDYNTINTVNTKNEKDENEIEKEFEDKLQDKSDNNFHKSFKKYKDNWIHATSNKLRLDFSVIKSILYVTNNNVSKARKLTGLILNAKKNIVKNEKLSANDPLTRFESNDNLSKPLADKIVHIFSYAPKDPSQNVKYLMACFKDFFKHAFGLLKPENKTPEMNSVSSEQDLNKELDIDGPDIPIFKIGSENFDVPKHYTEWITEDDYIDGPDIPIFKIQ